MSDPKRSNWENFDTAVDRIHRGETIDGCPGCYRAQKFHAAWLEKQPLCPDHPERGTGTIPAAPLPSIHFGPNTELPKHVTNAFVVNRCYNETALELGPQPRFTVEEERAIKNALLKAYQAGERGDKE